MIRRVFLLLLLGLTQILHAQETADHGFIHPGGLHTQADFDRVKAQIAAKNQTVVKARRPTSPSSMVTTNNVVFTTSLSRA